MKKILTLCALLLCLTGCGKEEKELDKVPADTREPKTVVLDATTKMDSLESVKGELDFTATFKNGEEEQTTNSKFIVDANLKDKIYKTETTYEIDGEKETTIQYKQEEDGKNVSYFESDGTWYQSTDSENFDLMSIIDSVKKTTEVTKKESKYEIKLTEADMKVILEETELSELTTSDKVSVYVTVENDYITSVEVIASISYEDITGTASANYKFSKFNELGDLKVPEEIINSAKSFDIGM